MIAAPAEIIGYWRDTVGAKRWFATDKTLDVDIRRRFLKTWEAAKAGRLKDWEDSVEATLALLLVLDQFPRNMFRGEAQAFATDAQARDVARRAIAKTYDLGAADLQAFFYLPFMHSEDLAEQDYCVSLIETRLGRASMNYPFALAHRHEIVAFGRFPGRNKALGRRSTPGEARYLAKQSVKG